MKYRQEYHYQLAEDEVFDDVDIWPGQDISTDFIDLSADAILTVKAGYAWDGPSGPTFDSRSAMRGSLGHDAIYQMFRQGHLPHTEALRDKADSAFSRWLEQDGMGRFRRWYWMRGVRNFAGSAADPANKKEMLVAP